MTYPCHWFSEQVGLAGDLGSTNDVPIPLIDHNQHRLLYADAFNCDRIGVSSAFSQVEMDDSNITVEECIELEDEKAHRHGQTFNWETATYGKVMYYEDIDYFKDFETDFPAIVYKDALAHEHEISSEPT
ncbi:hypothetical protein Tco_0555572, partial [Tanacetum coccineum]